MLSHLITFAIQADRERQIEETMRRGSLLGAASRPAALSRVRSRLGSGRRKQPMTRVPSYR
jgi:hypothetical protein